MLNWYALLTSQTPVNTTPGPVCPSNTTLILWVCAISEIVVPLESLYVTLNVTTDPAILFGVPNVIVPLELVGLPAVFV